MIDSKELRKIVKFCQKNGILRFKSGDFEIDIKEKLNFKQPSDMPQTADASFLSWDSLSPEQKLLWSSTPDVGENQI